MIDRNNFLIYLEKNYPHLHKVEMLIEKIKGNTQHGNVFVDLRVIGGRVDKYSISWSESGFVMNRKDNKLTE